ncbi:unnamed protein product [Ascophyllum nodosum]
MELARSPLLSSDPKSALLDVWDTLDAQFYEICVQEWQAARDLPKKAINSGGAEGHHKKRVQKDHHKKRVQKDRKKRARKGLPVSTAPSFPRAGSTATVLLIVGNKVFVANCGDSAGILVKKDGSAEIITKDHGTLNRKEFERVQQSGGYYRPQSIRVPRSPPLCCFTREMVVGKPRVYPGGLLVTRSFGDFSAKVTGLGGTPGVILPNCEEIVEMTVEEDWAELVIASDGVWDVVSPHDMPQILTRLGRGNVKRMGSSGSSSGDDYRGRRYDGKAPEETLGSDGARRLKQANLNCTSAKLILGCIRDRYWQDNQSQADNASVIILKFFQSDSPGEGELPHPSQEHVEAQSDTTQP